MRLSYDTDVDVLYVSFGASQEAISEETGDGMLLRRHPDTGDIVGVTILGFEERLEQSSASALLPVVLDRVRAA
jgi:uncharacterized protein YuzE